jgi:hypothetical protein
MTNRTSKSNIDWLGKSFQSGHVNVSLNGKKVGEVAIENGSFQIDLPDNLKASIAVDKLPSKMKELSIAHSISRILSSLGLRIDVHENGKEIASLGKGVHSLLGNVKLKISRLKKIM